MRSRADPRPPPLSSGLARPPARRWAGFALALIVHILPLLPVAGCGPPVREDPDRRAASTATAPPGAWERALASDSAFGRLHARLSEPGGYFDTDNLISNEASYLHVIGELEARGVRGGAYVGVGPDQNFSYIAAVRPRVAFIVDIRRDNVLQHLLFRALSERSETRIQYLCLLVGRRCPERPAGGGGWEGRGIGELVDAVDAAGPDPRAAQTAREAVLSRVGRFGIPLSESDRATIARFHEAFIRAGLDLRFSSHGRPPRPYYPTLRQLLLERARDGRRRSWMATEEGFRFVKSLSDRNLIVPVVGDLAGDHALAAIGRLLEERGELLSAFYVSNVEFYLWREGRFDAFVRNLAALPHDERGVIIRSYFGGGFRPPHPRQVPGYVSAQLLDPVAAMLEAYRGGGIRTYHELVSGEIAIRAGAGRRR